MLFLISCGNSKPVEDLPTMTFSTLVMFTETEGVAQLSIPVNLNKPAMKNSSFLVSTADYTAVAGEDYEAIQAREVIIEKGSSSTQILINILGDAIHEKSEEFYLNISSPDGLSLISAKITVLINDNDVYVEPPLVIPTTGYVAPTSYNGMQLVWQDEFSAETLNTDLWGFDIGGSGWGNNESQYYTDKNHSIVDGNLVIEARKELFGGNAYTSSRLVTRNKYEFTYGRVDVRAALPYGQGIWPAIWMLGANIDQVGWPKCGEIDIMEMIGGTEGDNSDNKMYGTLHWDTNGADYSGHASSGGSKSFAANSLQSEFHVYSIVWTSTSIKWLVDNAQFFELNTSSADFSEFDLPHYLLLNLAVGGNWPGYPDETTEFPQRLIVDYVRVFQ